MCIKILHTVKEAAVVEFQVYLMFQYKQNTIIALGKNTFGANIGEHNPGDVSLNRRFRKIFRNFPNVEVFPAVRQHFTLVDQKQLKVF